MKLIGVIGSAGSGKDTFAHFFSIRGYKRYAFADAVKDCCAAAFGIPRHHFDHRSLKEAKDSYWNISPREVAQTVGTELFRNTLPQHFPNHPGFIEGRFWINRMYANFVKDFSHKNKVKAIISDCRFKDECDFILDNKGVLIHLTRPGYEGNVGITGHASEAFASKLKETYGENNAQIIYLVNDGTLADLQTKVNAIYHSITA